MRLQSKRAVNADMANQRKRQIDEGLELAKKIDVLRRTYLEEEAKLNTFRTVTVMEVQKEIDELIKKRDSLK